MTQAVSTESDECEDGRHGDCHGWPCTHLAHVPVQLPSQAMAWQAAPRAASE